jgi:hypothetical protein
MAARGIPSLDDRKKSDPVKFAGGPGPGTRIETRVAPAQGGLAEICALELFNHIVAGEIYRRCQNENCGRLFVRQYGRAEHGMSRRAGVMYCSASCARARAQREHRRRKAAKRTRPPTKRADTARDTPPPNR